MRLTDGSEGTVIKEADGGGGTCWLVRTPGLDSWALLSDIEAFL
ncbi:hypothetical protein [Myceligenerans halotolerans]